MKKLYQVLTVIALTGVSMTALANLPVRQEDKCDKCRPTPTEPCCDDEAKNDGINNGCVNITIPFGRAATEFETELKSYFQIFSLKPSAAIFSPQGLQFYNLFTNRINRNLHQAPITSLDPDLLKIYTDTYDPNAPDHKPGGSSEPSGPPPIYFMDEKGNIFPGESVGITDSAVSRYITILTTNGDSLEFTFKSGDKTALLGGTDKNAGYILAMTNASGAQVSSNPVYYDLYLNNGNYIRFDAATNECLAYILPSGRELSASMLSVGLEVIYDSDGIVRQVYSVRDGLADIVVTPEDDPEYADGSRYEIRLYDYANSGAKDAATGLYIPVGEPHTVWSIECPIPDQINEVRIVKKTGGVSYPYYYTYNFSLNDWVLDYPDNLIVVSKIQVLNGSGRTQTTTTKTGSGAVASVVQDVIQSTPNGDRLKSRILDPNGAKLKTDYTYTDDGQKATMRQYNGYWEKYAYDDAGRRIEVASPWKNARFGAGPADTKVVSYSYTPVYSADKLLPADQRPRKIQEKVLGVLTSQTLKAYYTAGGCYFEAVQQCPGESSWNSSANLKTIKQYYAKTADAASRGRVWKITYPDNTMDTYTYEYGNWTQAATPEACSFTAGTGDALRVSVVHGAKSSANGIANQSTKETTVYDIRGNIVQTEQYAYTGGTGYERIAWEVMTYNGSNQKIAQYYSDGAGESWTWNCCNIESHTDRTGVIHSYTYDAIQRMIADVRTTNDSSIPAQTISYAYNAKNQILNETASSGNLSLTEITTYDFAGRKTSSTDASGLTTAYAYSYGSSGSITTLTLPGNATAITSVYCSGQLASVTGTSQVAQYYDYGVETNGNLWTKASIAAADSPRWQKSWSNPLRQIVKNEKSGYNGSVITELSYNNLGQQITETATGSPLKVFEYDNLGRLTTVCLKNNTGASISLSSADRIAKREQKFEKDGGIWYSSVIDTIYGTTGSSAATQVNKQRNQLTNLGTFAAVVDQTDIHGNTVTRKTTVIPSESKVRTETFYPHTSETDVQTAIRGLVVESENIFGRRTDYTYDGLDRIEYVDDGGLTLSYFYYDSGVGQSGKVSNTSSNYQPDAEYFYDPATGRLACQQNSNGDVTRYAYNDRGELLRTWGNAAYPTEVAFDNYGQLTQLKTYRTGDNWNGATWPSPVPAADVTTWTFDAASGLVTKKTDAAGNATDYAYTVDGKLSSRTWARKINNQTLTANYAYNVFNDLASVTYPAGTGVPATSNLAFTYNRLGQPLTVTDATGTHTFTYNSTFELQKEAVTGSFYTPTLNYTYTTSGWKGNNLNLKLGSDDVYAYTYADRISGVTVPGVQPATVGYTWNNLDRITKIDIPTMPSNYTFDKNRLTAFSFGYTEPDGGGTMNKTGTWSYNYSYDSDYRISSQSYEYSYRDFGWAVPAHNNSSFTYSYNSKSELIRALRQASSMDSDGMLDIELDTSYNYYYDQIGNRTSSVTAEFPTVYTSNNLNQYTAISGIANPTYDADGNLLTYDGWTYTWNMENRLVKAEKGATRLEFNYDYMGRRIEKKIFSSNNLIKHLKFVYDGYKLIAELDGMNSNAQLRRYTWNAPETGLDTPLAMYNVADSSTYYYRAGANKNVMALTSGKAVVAQYEYSPFGTIITQTGDLAAVNPFRFSSEYHDDETGLIYYNYRYYNPTLGRWLSRDPIGEDGGENLYGFVNNNPINSFDELGLYDPLNPLSSEYHWNPHNSMGGATGDYMPYEGRRTNATAATQIWNKLGLDALSSLGAAITILGSNFNVTCDKKLCCKFCISLETSTALSLNIISSKTLNSLKQPVSAYGGTIFGGASSDGSEISGNLGINLGFYVGISTKLVCVKINNTDIHGCPCPDPSSDNSTAGGMMK